MSLFLDLNSLTLMMDTYASKYIITSKLHAQGVSVTLIDDIMIVNIS